jgi:hypothetical protein
MSQITLAEVLAMPDPLLNDNFDLHALGGSEKFPLPDAFLDSLENFDTVRMALVRVDQVQMPKGKKGRVTLGFYDQLGDQKYLDTFAAFNDNFGSLTIQQYNQSGEPVRHTVFSELEFLNTVIALEASSGQVVQRFVSFEFDSVQEVDIAERKTTE